MKCSPQAASGIDSMATRLFVWGVCELPQRPARVLSYDFVLVIRELPKSGDESMVSAVSHRDRYIAQQTASFGSFDRRATKGLAKLFGREPRKRFKLGVYQACSWLEVRNRRQRRVAVPRANILADGASKDLPSCTRRQS